MNTAQTQPLKQEAVAKSVRKATMTMRIRRHATGEWEDGPEVHTVEVGLTRWQDIRLMVLGKMLQFLSKLRAKLEEMQK